jgi:hypothetical protein
MQLNKLHRMLKKQTLRTQRTYVPVELFKMPLLTIADCSKAFNLGRSWLLYWLNREVCSKIYVVLYGIHKNERRDEDYVKGVRIKKNGLTCK